jgi:hypothetical protein
VSDGDGEGVWRVRMGFGLLEHCPMSPERRAQFDKEAEREAKAAAFEQELREQNALERRAELLRTGHEPHSVGDVHAMASRGMDSTDRVEGRREREALEEAGKPIPAHLNKFQLKREQQQREATEISRQRLSVMCRS